MIQARITTDRIGRTYYWIRASEHYSWQRMSRWWVEVALRIKMAKLIE